MHAHCLTSSPVLWRLASESMVWTGDADYSFNWLGTFSSGRCYSGGTGQEETRSEGSRTVCSPGGLRCEVQVSWWTRALWV
jgi:hypothetical protein